MRITNSTDLAPLLKKLTDKRPKGRAVAAFDADGTLWDIDLGETFFEYEINNKVVPLPEDPWKHYEDMQKYQSKEEAYLWLAQIHNGVPLEQVRRWASLSVESIKPQVPVFEIQKQVIAHLLSLEVEVYIVTASIKWAVEPAAHLFGLTPDHVFGIETELVNGCVGMKQKGILTYRAGKPARLIEHTGGVVPYFCSGNTEGDLELLKAATDLRFVMSNTDHDHPNHKTEQVMVEMAKKNGWFYHSQV